MGGDDCGDTLCTYIFFLINLFIFIFGVVGIGVGIWALKDKNQMESLSKVTTVADAKDFNAPGLLQTGAIIMVVGGTVLTILGFMGCWGALREIKLLLFLYATLLVIILVEEVVAGIMAALMKKKFESNLKRSLLRNIEEHYDGQWNSTNIFTQALDFAQIFFECCGIDSFSEYKSRAKFWVYKETMTVPPACCAIENKDDFMKTRKVVPKDWNCTINPTMENSYVAQPCFPRIKNWLIAKANVITAVAFTIVILEIIGILMACSLLRTAMDKEDLPPRNFTY